MKRTLMILYLSVGGVVCLWFTTASALGWRAPDFGVVKAMKQSGSSSRSSRGYGGYYGGGRGFGGSWGGGK